MSLGFTFNKLGFWFHLIGSVYIHELFNEAVVSQFFSSHERPLEREMTTILKFCCGKKFLLLKKKISDEEYLFDKI